MIIYEALKKDHEKVRSMLDELVSLNENADDRRHNLIDDIRDELIPHARAEEAVFYNSLRSIENARDLVTHAYKEHMEAEMYLRMLQIRDKIDASWKETAKKLQESVEHHIEEEENKVIPAAEQLFTPEEANMLGEAFEKLKPDVQTEGFMKTTLDLVANIMPQRFAETLRTWGLRPGQDKAAS